MANVPRHFSDANRSDGRGWMHPIEGHPLHLSIARDPETDLHHVIVALIAEDGKVTHLEEADDLTAEEVDAHTKAMVAQHVKELTGSH